MTYDPITFLILLLLSGMAWTALTEIGRSASMAALNLVGLVRRDLGALAARGDVKAIADRLDQDLNQTDAVGRTPMHRAAEKNRDAVVELLARHGAAVDLKNRGGHTPLVAALLYRGSTEASVRALLKHGADPNQLCNQVHPLIFALRQFTLPSGSLSFGGQYESARDLIQAGAECEIDGSRFGSLLLQAIEGPSDDIRDYQASKNHATELAMLMIERGADVNVTDEVGRTPLHLAVKAFPDESFDLAGTRELVRRLIERGACVNRKDKVGQTPLHSAVYKGNVNLVKILVEAGATVSKRRDGLTPLEVVEGLKKRDQGRYQQLAEALDRASLDKSAGHDGHEFRRGVELLTEGDPQRALLEFQKSHDAADGTAKADSLYNIALCHLRLGSPESAVQAARRALAIDPKLASELRSDADFSALMADTSFLAALDDADRLSRDPDYSGPGGPSLKAG